MLLVAFSGTAAEARGNDGGGDVRVAGVCGSGATTSLRIRARDDGIEVRLVLRLTRGWGVWRVTIVHESRVAARVTVRARRSEDALEVRRTLSDLPGSDTVVAQAWGPGGLGCRATAALPG
jgi:hypothetical protein